MSRFALPITLLAAAAGTALALALWSGRAAEPFALADRGRLDEVAAARAALVPRSGKGGPEARPYYLSEEVVLRIFLIDETFKVYDPWCYFRERPGRSVRIEWPEHPDGHWTLATNSLGFRDDEPGGKADFEVVVVGDSNTAGVCNQEESYANRLELLLAASRPDETVSVLNVGTGGYGPFNYVGAVEMWSHAAPDVFVVAIFGGNDFSEALELNRILTGRPGPLWKGGDETRRTDVVRRHPLPMAHGLNSAYMFARQPHLEAAAVAVVLKLAAEMKVVCDEGGTRLVVLYVPEPFAFPWAPPVEGDAEAREMLGLQPEDLGSLSRIADRVLEGLRALDVPAVDLRPVFADQPVPPYWRTDLHVNLEGHELAARALFGRVVEE